MTQFDVIVAGRGPAGLAAACLVAGSGKRVALVGQPQSVSDPRTVALMQPSIRLLETIGLWPGDLEARTTPLRRLRMVDDTGSVIAAPEVMFDAQEIGEEAFGWNIPLALLLPSLEARAGALGVTMFDSDVTSARPAGSGVTLRTGGGETLETLLVLAADGRNSLLRDTAGIATNSWTYDQTAMATSFAHSGPHQDVSTEYHRPAGPCTTVPMPDGRSALVWMERPARVAELMAMADGDLAREIQLATHGDLGLVSGIGPRRAFPMQGLVARDFARNRIMLIGEAAHVVPPIGAQGLNMSLRDAATAAEIIQSTDDPGSAAAVASYDASRRRDVQPRQQVIDLMNRSLLSGLMPMHGARAAGLALIAGFAPLRRFMMRQGIGLVEGLPESMAARRAG